MKETIQGAAAVYYNRGIIEWHSKHTKARTGTAAAQSYIGKLPACLISRLRRDDIPFKLFCYNILLCLTERRNLVVEQFKHKQHNVLAFTKSYKPTPYPGTIASWLDTFAIGCCGKIQIHWNRRASKQTSQVTMSKTQQRSGTSHTYYSVNHPKNERGWLTK